MFGKQVVQETVDSEPTGRGEMKLATCGPGVRCAAVIGRKVVVMAAAGLGLPAAKLVLPLPPGGRIIALHADGPTALTVRGELWLWEPRNDRWERAFSIAEATP